MRLDADPRSTFAFEFCVVEGADQTNESAGNDVFRLIENREPNCWTAGAGDEPRLPVPHRYSA